MSKNSSLTPTVLNHIFKLSRTLKTTYEHKEVQCFNYILKLAHTHTHISLNQMN